MNNKLKSSYEITKKQAIKRIISKNRVSQNLKVAGMLINHGRYEEKDIDDSYYWNSFDYCFLFYN